MQIFVPPQMLVYCELIARHGMTTIYMPTLLCFPHFIATLTGKLYTVIIVIVEVLL